MGRVFTKLGPLAVTLVMDGIHLAVTRIRDKDSGLIKSSGEIEAVKTSWEKKLLTWPDQESMDGPTPGEYQELVYKERIINRMRNGPGPALISTGSTYSVQVIPKSEVI